MGEHTDYNGGFCLPVPLDRRTWVAAAPRDDERRRKARQSTQKAREDEGDSRQERYEPRMVQGERGKHRATS